MISGQVPLTHPYPNPCPYLVISKAWGQISTVSEAQALDTALSLARRGQDVYYQRPEDPVTRVYVLALD